jgi:hypothetical protein
VSRQRLEAVLNFLTSRDWELLTPDEYPDASADPFRLEEEEIVWAIRRAGGRVIALRFQADDLGGHTNDLRDIFCCTVAGAPEIKRVGNTNALKVSAAA